MRSSGKLLVPRDISVVYCGGVFERERTYIESIFDTIKGFTSDKVHFYLYTFVPAYLDRRFKLLDKKDKYFHYMGSLPHEKLLKEITKYDFGIACQVRNVGKLKFHPYLWNTIGNRVYDYVQCGLPILYHPDALTYARFCEENGVGIKVSSYKGIRKQLSSWLSI